MALVDAKMEEQGKPKMSFFEVLTAMAIWKFADTPVDVAIVEVGMGGLWDATNVLNAVRPSLAGGHGPHAVAGRPSNKSPPRRAIIKPNCRHHRPAAA